jgi:hypothetical protein
MPMVSNPYRWDKVNIDLFYGRNQLRYELVEGLRNGQSFGITGGRRMGKTTLLRRVEADFRECAQQWADGGLFVIPIYIDGLSLSRPITSGQVLDFILQKIRNCTAPMKPVANSYSSLNPFTAQLAQQIKDINASNHRPQIIVLFDEIEPILSCDWGKGFFANWRALLHNEPEISPYISAVFAGASEMFQLARDVGSPLGNILSWRELRLFSFEDTRLLVNEPTNNSLSSEFAKRVFQETGGHPALIQYLMKFVCDRDLDTAEQSLGQALESFYIYERDKFEGWWKKFPSLAQQVYAQILSAGTPVSRQFLIQSFNSTDIGRALDILCHSGVVSYDDERDSYVAAGQMFPRWFNQFGIVQTTPELSERVDRLLRDVERALRNLLQKHLSQKYGEDWLTKYVANISTKTREGTVSLLDAWCANAKRPTGNLRTEEALLYAELGDLFTLISREWGDLKNYFEFSRDPGKNRLLFDERKDCLVAVRNALRHVREETISATELLKAQAFCAEIIERLR